MSSGRRREQIGEASEHGRPSVGIQRRVVDQSNEFGEASKAHRLSPARHGTMFKPGQHISRAKFRAIEISPRIPRLLKSLNSFRVRHLRESLAYSSACFHAPNVSGSGATTPPKSCHPDKM